MNEQLQAELLKIVANINSGVDSAWGFITEQTPEVVYQLLLWHGVCSAVLTAFGLILMLCLAYINYRQLKWFIKIDNKADYPQMMVNMFQIFPIILFCSFINLTWLKIWIAPKVWLLEYIGTMVK